METFVYVYLCSFIVIINCTEQADIKKMLVVTLPPTSHDISVDNTTCQAKEKGEQVNCMESPSEEILLYENCSRTLKFKRLCDMRSEYCDTTYYRCVSCEKLCTSKSEMENECKKNCPVYLYHKMSKKRTENNTNGLEYSELSPQTDDNADLVESSKRRWWYTVTLVPSILATVLSIILFVLLKQVRTIRKVSGYQTTYFHRSSSTEHLINDEEQPSRDIEQSSHSNDNLSGCFSDAMNTNSSGIFTVDEQATEISEQSFHSNTNQTKRFSVAMDTNSICPQKGDEQATEIVHLPHSNTNPTQCYSDGIDSNSICLHTDDLQATDISVHSPHSNTNQTQRYSDAMDTNSSCLHRGDEQATEIREQSVHSNTAPTKICSDATDTNSSCLQRGLGPQNQEMLAGNIRSVNIDEEYKKFKKTIKIHKAPFFIQSCNCDAETQKIYVDIDERHCDEGKSFLQNNFKDQWNKNLFKIVLQGPQEYAVLVETNPPVPASSSNAPSIPYLAKSKVQEGCRLISLPAQYPDEKIALICQQYKSIEDLCNGLNIDKSTPHGTGAGFVKDYQGKDQPIYMLSSWHVFKQPLDGVARNERLPILTEICHPNGNDGNGEGQLIYLGSKFSGKFGTDEDDHGIDMSLIKILKSALESGHIELGFTDDIGNHIQMDAFEGNDRDLMDIEVEKIGCISGITSYGKIISNKSVNVEHSGLWEGCFLVKSCESTHDKIGSSKSVSTFASRGDSGGLVKQMIRDDDGKVVKATAISLIFKLANDIKDSTGGSAEYAVWCVPIKHCFNFAKHQWKMNLKFCNQCSNEDETSLEENQASIGAHNFPLCISEAENSSVSANRCTVSDKNKPFNEGTSSERSAITDHAKQNDEAHSSLFSSDSTDNAEKARLNNTPNLRDASAHQIDGSYNTFK